MQPATPFVLCVLLSQVGKRGLLGAPRAPFLHSDCQIAGLVKEARPCQRILEDIFSQGEEIMKNRLSLLK